MSEKYQFPQTVVIVTDDLSNATKAAKKMATIAAIELYNWETFSEADLEKFDIPVFDVDLRSGKNVARLKKIQKNNEKAEETVFSVDHRNHVVAAQANALGVNVDVKRPLNSRELTRVIIKLCTNQKNLETIKVDRKNITKKSADASVAVSDMMDGLMIAIRKGGTLPVEEMQQSSAQIIEAVAHADMDTWLKAVRSHSSYTYRHVMVVTGFAAAFASKYNLSKSEQERLTLGALIHDIGKVKVPQKILDKPGKLDSAELKKMQRHSIDGAIILSRDSRMSQELIMIARSHHEYLDGSGYPDGLIGEDIPDIVRLITVIDIFSALLEARSYKQSMKPQDAYNALLEMGDKIDQDIVRAFEPIALDEEAHLLVKAITGSAA